MTIDDDDRAAIEAIVMRQSAAWKAGEADAFAADATDGVLFTNVVGMFSIGRAPFIAQHAITLRADLQNIFARGCWVPGQFLPCAPRSLKLSAEVEF